MAALSHKSHPRILRSGQSELGCGGRNFDVAFIHPFSKKVYYMNNTMHIHTTHVYRTKNDWPIACMAIQHNWQLTYTQTYLHHISATCNVSRGTIFLVTSVSEIPNSSGLRLQLACLVQPGILMNSDQWRLVTWQVEEQVTLQQEGLTLTDVLIPCIGQRWLIRCVISRSEFTGEQLVCIIWLELCRTGPVFCKIVPWGLPQVPCQKISSNVEFLIAAVHVVRLLYPGC